MTHKASSNNHTATPRTTKLKKIAAVEAKKHGRRSEYSPVVGAEHCPACWSRARASIQLRTEPHHNGSRVYFVTCDACGLYVVL